MRLVFMGSPDFAVPALRGLHSAGHEITAVYCQAPKPAGRGQRLTQCAVHETANALNIQVRTPQRLRGDAEELAYLKSLDLDYIVVAAYGLILPEEFLKTPRLGCLNIHASLLPRWRGAAPIQAAILAGDDKTGITIMQMDAGLDTGSTILSESITIGPADTSVDLHARLAVVGKNLILNTLINNFPRIPQTAGSTYAPKLSRGDAKIDWYQRAVAIERRIRAFTPWPGTETTLHGKTLKILAAEVVSGSGVPGTVIDQHFTIACGEQALRLKRVKRAGSSTMSAEAYLRGNPLATGTRLA